MDTLPLGNEDKKFFSNLPLYASRSLIKPDFTKKDADMFIFMIKPVKETRC